MENEVRDPYEYEVDLRDYIKVIWKEKWIITLIFIIAVGTALAFSLTTEPEYRTQASLVITSTVADKLVSRPGKTPARVDFIPEYDYEEEGLSNEILEAIITDLDLTTGSGKTMSLNSLKNRMSINLAFPDSSKNETNKPTLTLTVTGSNREKIKEIADKWTELSVQRVSKLLSREINRYYELVSKEYSEVREKLETKIEERIEVREETDLEFLEVKSEVLQGDYRNYLSSLGAKKLELEKKRAQLSSLKSSLEEVPKYFYLDRSIPSEILSNFDQPASEETENGEDDQSNNNWMDNSMAPLKEQRVNEVFLSLTERKIELNLERSSLKREVDYLETALGKLKERINENQARVERTKLKVETLNRAVRNLRYSSYSLYSELETARAAREEKVSPIKTLKVAKETEVISKVNTKQNVAVAGVLGLFVGVLVAFFKNYMEGYEEETEKEEENKETED
ncbi:hypothetical protein K9M78_05765 [Candidatus Bipolaricaulota bacterium]|nr:hypothetical protein [Candidatus Bipolaricaulota bacterium]